MALNHVMPSVMPHAMSLATLYVGDLHPDITEAILFDKFITVGPLLSLHVCRDIMTRRSLGYAYVNFQSAQDAERALDTMNFDLVRGLPIRIMWSQRDPSLRKSGIGNIFIKNLDKSIDNKDMFDTFSAFGNIMSCKVAQDDNGISKGYGFVHFETQEAANKAIAKVNGMLLNGKKVFVGKFIPRFEREKELGDKYKIFTNVYVNNFGDKLDDEVFLNMFEKFGQITSYKIMKNDDGSSKGFGFVAYKEAKSAEEVVKYLNGKEIVEGMSLYVGRAQKKQERQKDLKNKYEQMKRERYTRCQGSNLYVKNLDDSFDDDRLCKEFEPFGTISSAIVMKENGRSKGFGFVCFSTPEEASKAVTEMNNRVIGNKPLYVALAQRKEDRKIFLTSVHTNRMANFRAHHPQFSSNMNGFYPPQMIPATRFYTQPIIAQLRNSNPTPRWPIPAQIRPGVAGGSMASLSGPVFSGRPYRAPSMTNNNNGRSNLSRPITGGQEGHRPEIRNTSITATNAPVIRTRNQQPRQVRFQEPRSTSFAIAADPQKQKQVLGERLFPLIFPSHPTLAGKITGMLLEIDNSELVHMLDDQDSLQAKMSEAVALLKAHEFPKPVEAVQ